MFGDDCETVIVVPCYNEANRLREKAFLDFINDRERLCILFVNDGSNDGTLDILRNICNHAPHRLHLLNLDTNRGKAEAIRSGFIEAIKWGPNFIAMWDADLATPLSMVIEFLEFMRNNESVILVMGSRVKLLGRRIERSRSRHILGRLAATLISYTLKLEVYDTQCGAKLFRVNDLTRSIFNSPFLSTWIFDVELIARLIQARKGKEKTPLDQLICEIPLHEWIDVGGSKIRPGHYARSLVELLRIKMVYLSDISARNNQDENSHSD
ncbi:MAG: glycosyltransferase [Desulfomonilaceae bacterium]